MTSFDPDHALAILLQAKFNEEAKEQREKEKENLPVPVSVRGFKASSSSSSSLVDPEWEVTDPCPDIHGLFLAFNDRFFWGRLLGVEVKWSPQMTSCAGICVYEGRNGLCSVRLSAPLLKLRPRSDLVETLLHEMIHAYLFVTHNNRDREGHGPEFHKHMNRINKEAGTNITVYHSFHAEVKLYQQHWWRCDGPCQKRPPFFGMVKRARNRAPGPNDFWWADHQAACGGRFIKIREPEGYGAKGKGKEKEVKAIKPKEGTDIRNFFKKPVNVKGDRSLPSKSSTGEKVGSNVFGFKNLGSNQSSVASVKTPNRGVNRVVGFRDLSASASGATNSPKKTFGSGHVLGGGKGGNLNGKHKPSTPGQRGGMLANRGGGTLVVTGTKSKSKPDEKSPSPNTKLRIDNFKVFSGSGFTLGGSSENVDRSRSRLLSLGNEPEKKKQKTDVGKQENMYSCSDMFGGKDKNDDMCNCSVCNKSMPREEIESHLENCEGLKNVFNDSFVIDDVDNDEINEINKKSKITSCPVCALNIEGDINLHLDECLARSGIMNLFDDSPDEVFYPPDIGVNESSLASGLFDEPTIAINDADSPIVLRDDSSLGSPIVIRDDSLIVIRDDSPIVRDDSPIVISDTESPQFSGTKKTCKPKSDCDSDVEIIESERRILCMICGLRFGESRINAHVNECLDSQDD